MKKLLVCFAFALQSCAGFKVADFKAHVTLPASGDGYWVKTVSNEEGRIPKEQWDVMKKRGIVLLSEDWAILKTSLRKACLSNKCDDVIGVFDDLFNSLDEALKTTKGK